MKALKMKSFIKSYNESPYFDQINLPKERLYKLSTLQNPLLNLSNDEYSTIQSFIDRSYKYEDHTYDTSNFIDFDESQFIGVDIGIGKIITCSDNKGRRWYHSNKLRCQENWNISSNAIYHFERVAALSGSNRSHRKKQTFVNQMNNWLRKKIITDVRTIVQDIIKFYGPSRVYLLGESYTNYNYLDYDQITINFVKNLVYEVFFELIYNSGLNSFVLDIDESTTSIKCPVCKHKHQSNRTNTNSFKCRKCGYYNKNDDIVACMNIVNSYISLL